MSLVINKRCFLNGRTTPPWLCGEGENRCFFLFLRGFLPFLLFYWFYEIGNKILPKPPKKSVERTDVPKKWYGTPNAHFSSFLRLCANFADREINNSFSIFLIIKHIRLTSLRRTIPDTTTQGKRNILLPTALDRGKIILGR